jgi:hypothetical protein
MTMRLAAVWKEELVRKLGEEGRKKGEGGHLSMPKLSTVFSMSCSGRKEGTQWGKRRGGVIGQGD